MNLKEIDEAIEVLKVCQYCWADQVANDGQVIADYDAIKQAIDCLKEYKKSKKKTQIDKNIGFNEIFDIDKNFNLLIEQVR